MDEGNWFTYWRAGLTTQNFNGPHNTAEEAIAAVVRRSIPRKFKLLQVVDEYEIGNDGRLTKKEGGA